MVKWRDVYSIGIDKIDEDHKKLFELLNKLEDSIKHLKHEEISSLLNSLIAYSKNHFNYEISEMISNDYPEELIKQHDDEHNQFLVDVFEIEKKSMSLTFGLMVNTSNFLKDWIINHLLGSDKEFTEFLKNVK